MKLDRLVKQKAALEAQIAAAETALKNKARLEKFLPKAIAKYEHLFSANPELVEKELSRALAEVAARIQA